jgi:hypothetical protein
VVVATPGRLADQLENNLSFKLDRVKYLVMDEADRLLEGEDKGTGPESGSLLLKGPKHENLWSEFLTLRVGDLLTEIKITFVPFLTVALMYFRRK